MSFSSETLVGVNARLPDFREVQTRKGSNTSSQCYKGARKQATSLSRDHFINAQQFWILIPKSEMEVVMAKSTMAATLTAVLLLVLCSLRADAQLSGTLNFVVLHVTFSDFGTGTRFTTTQVQTNFNNVADLWGTQSSYGNITIQYQFGGPYQVDRQVLPIWTSRAGNFPRMRPFCNSSVMQSRVLRPPSTGRTYTEWLCSSVIPARAASIGE